MKRLVVYIVGVWGLLAVGCSSGVDEKYLVNGKDAGKYFSKFVYKEGDNNTFQYLRSTPTPVRQESGESIFGEFLVFLLAQKDAKSGNLIYKVKYREYVADEGDSSRFKLSFDTEFLGTWRVDKSQLVLQNLGVGTGIEVNDVEMVQLNVTEELASRLPKTKDFILEYRTSAEGLD